MVLQTLSWLTDSSYGLAQAVIRSPETFYGIFLQKKQPPELVVPITTTVAKVTEVGMIISSSSRIFVRLAGISGALAVGLGAYGAHVFYQRDISEEFKQVYETANRYHFLHTLALLGVPLCKRPKIAGTLLTLGMTIFSGTCYYYALTGSKTVRQFTPYGGMLLIAGWLSMVL